MERGPTRGPGVPDKSTPEDEIQLDEDSVFKTSFRLDSQSDTYHNQLSVDGIINHGFIIQGRELIGRPLAILPEVVVWWNINHPAEITADSLALFYTCFPPVELVIIGTGDRSHFIDPREIEKLHERGLKVEIQPTRAACGTYNLLKNDKRVGLAIIPLKDIKKEKMKRKLESGLKIFILAVF